MTKKTFLVEKYVYCQIITNYNISCQCASLLVDYCHADQLMEAHGIAVSLRKRHSRGSDEAVTLTPTAFKSNRAYVPHLEPAPAVHA